MSNTKKYILTAVTLGSIAAVAAGLIAATNLLTAKRIKQNEQDKIVQGISNIFGSGSLIKSENDLSGYDYVVHYYEVENSENEFVGFAIKAVGSNMYGKISLIAGFDAITHNFMSLNLISNEQSYASTLYDKYVVPLNNKQRDLEDVKCGATYGATLVKDMVIDAKKAADTLWSN